MLGRELGTNLILYAATRLDSRLEGLSDEEYLWEPVRDCWTIRPDGEDWRPDLAPGARTHTADGSTPFTTIAWRMWHIGASPDPWWPPTDFVTGEELVSRWFTPNPARVAIAIADATSARQALREVWRSFAENVERLSDDELRKNCGPRGGPFADWEVTGLVLHVADELIHHAAEIATLRDLFRTTHA